MPPEDPGGLGLRKTMIVLDTQALVWIKLAPEKLSRMAAKDGAG
jgi:hypothetical protein